MSHAARPEGQKPTALPIVSSLRGSSGAGGTYSSRKALIVDCWMAVGEEHSRGPVFGAAPTNYRSQA